MTSEPRSWNARADELSAAHIAGGEATAWFDRLYAEGVTGAVTMPWDRTDPHPMLREWAERDGVDGTGRRGVVVGCGLGADAAYLAELGFETTGFDISPHAIGVARERFADRGVDFRVADLLGLPTEWLGAFDLVVEIFTVQAVPDPPRTEMIEAIRGLVAPGGTLLAIQFRHDGSTALDDGPPFPLTVATMDSLAGDVLDVVARQELDGPLWRVEYHRPPAP
jgi:SAM-dependent methyltransferase